MNKIYKVVWSKAKHCYVVTSELAKRNGKGCGARSLRMAAVSMGVAAALLCTGHSLYDPSVVYAASEHVSNKTVVVPSDIYPAATSANKRVFGGWATSASPASNVIYGGFSSESTDSTNYNNVTIGNITMAQADGGWSTSGSSIGNSVTVNGGTVTGDVGTFYAHSIVGGYGWNGNEIKDNIVTLNAGTAENTIIAGIGYGTISGNQVIINSGSTVKGVQGGVHPNYDAYSKIDGNTVTIKGSTVNGQVQGGWITRFVSSGNIVTNNKVSITGSEVSGVVYGGGIGSGGDGTLTISGNEVTLGKDASITGAVYGGYTLTATGAVLSENKVTMNGGKALNVYGAYTQGGATEANHVVVNGGTVGDSSSGVAYGGWSLSGLASENKVTITNGTVSFACGGGTYSGTAQENTLTISGGKIIRMAYGGTGNGAVKDNIVNISGNAVVEGEVIGGRFFAGDDSATNVTGNKVNISGGTVNSNVIGGQSAAGKAESNKVTISGGTMSGIVYGGYTYSGDAKYNSVTINESGQVNNTVYGGCSENGGKTIGNTVTVGDSAKVTGGITAGFSPKSDAENNTVTVNNGTVSGYINGGVATGTAKENHIIINNGTVSYMQGGSGASATGNTIEVNNGTVSNTIRGGNSDAGTVSDNIVTINDGKVNGTIYGGSSNSGAVTNNKVTVTGGAINDIIWGGDSNGGDAKYNAVTISGDAKIVVEGIMGGRSWNSEATGNTVTISGGSFEPESQDPPFNTISITAGVSNANKLTAKDNVVNITGEVTGLDTAEISGYNYNITTHSGNELHVGGTKTYDSNGTATVSSSAAWQGKSSDGTVNNKVKSVAQFESIVLHNVKWGTTLPVLEATKITNIGTLDITNMQFDQTPSNGESMALLKAGNDLGVVGIGLAYKDGSTEKTATSAELATGVTFDSGALTDTAVNGVSVTGTQSKKVSLENSNYEIRYSFSSTISGITIATDTFTAGGTARAFGSGDNLTGATITNKLAFSLASKKNMASGTSMVILDATKAVAVSGATLPAFTAQTYKENFDDPISGKVLTLSGTHTDTLALNSTQTQLVYTVGNKNVETATFNGAVDFSTGDAYYKADSQYKFGKTNVDSQKLTFNETTEALAKGSSMTLLSATDITAGTVTQPDAPTVAIKYGGDATNGITFNATATGSVAVEDSAVKFKVNTVEASKIDLSNWNGTPADVATATSGWTLKAGETIETGELAKADLSGLKADETKTILTASDTVVFTNDAITGKKKWKEDGTSIAETTHESGVVISAGETTASGVKVNESNARQLIYHQGKNNVTAITLGEVTFNTAKAAREFGNAYDLTTADINATNFTIKDAAATAMNAGEEMIVLDATDAIKKADGTALKGFTAEPGSIAVDFTDKKVDGKELTFEGTHKDTLSLNDKKTQVVYKVGEKEVNKATFTGEVAWNDSEAYYDAAKGTAKYTFGATDVDATNLKVTGKTDKALKKGDAMTLISATGLKAGKVTQPTDAGSIDMNYSEKGITLAGKVAGEVKAADNAIKYEVTGVNVNKADIGSVAWQKDATLVDFSDKANNFAGVTTIGTNQFVVTYAKPEDVAANQSMTLLKANDSLKAIVNEEKAKVEKAYSVTPVDGVTVNAKLTSNVANTNGNVMVTAASNQASELKFEKVEWTGSNPLIDHKTTLRNVSFEGAIVDTSNIDFYKEMYIEADQTTTLVSNFGGTPKDIKGTTYKVGTAFDGEGSAALENGNLIFRTKTSAGVSEQTHKAVMGVEATMGLLATGKEHAGNVLDGLGNLSNVGSDGASVAASFGGGKDRYETGSHVNINSWSAAVGVGARKETKKGTLQYGIFGEYGKGNYTMHSDVGRSDGDAHYAGGGLMAKWTNKHDVYTEASFRLGRVSDSANDLLRDGAGNAYGYDIHATYYGAHIGLGKVFNYKGGKSLDVYGKFFYTKRDGAEFDAKQHYNLDSVNSSVLRIGARYGTTDKKWNWYGGLAYEYEFDGEAKGTVNGTEIRAASIKGSSVRGELGMKMSATKDNPWQADISIYGYGGKHRGFGGSVNVAYTF